MVTLEKITDNAEEDNKQWKGRRQAKERKTIERKTTDDGQQTMR